MFWTKQFVALISAFGLLSSSLSFGVAETTEMTIEKGAYDSPINAAVDIQYLPVRFPKFQWAEGMIDPKAGQAIRIGVEWMPFHRLYGKLGLGVATGFYQIKMATIDVDQWASVYAIPAEAYLTYRFDYVRNQILVPYLKGGTSAVFAQQTYRFGSPRPVYTYHGLDYGAGLELCLNAIDYRASRSLDASTGINTTYFVVEYVRSQQLNAAQENAPNLSRDELRFGLRFEM